LPSLLLFWATGWLGSGVKEVAWTAETQLAQELLFEIVIVHDRMMRRRKFE